MQPTPGRVPESPPSAITRIRIVSQSPSGAIVVPPSPASVLESSLKS